MKIRSFIKEDLPEVMNLCREVRQHHIDLLEGYFTEQNDEYEQIGFLESLENEKTTALVAIDNGKVIGYLLAEFKELPHLIRSKTAYVANFGVSAAFRNNGIGKQLMNAFLDICKENNIEEIRLGVYNKNTSAYAFYENFGFHPLEQKMILNLSE